jgi:hypothetical protein
MKLAVMQPYFFPYLGYFDLFNMVDEWIFFDSPQYMRHHWLNRNRILHPQSGWQYVIVPLRKHHQKTPLNEIEINMESDWRGRIVRQLRHYQKHAPHFKAVMCFLEECLALASPNLVETNIRTLRRTCQRLGIEKPTHVYSRMNLALPPGGEGPGDWALRISRAHGATEYINRPGGAGLFAEQQFREHHLKLTIQSWTDMPYTCGKYKFEPGLSILDVMMWNSCEQIRAYLDTFRLGQPKGVADARVD